jgi:hypothetical protein
VHYAATVYATLLQFSQIIHDTKPVGGATMMAARHGRKLNRQLGTAHQRQHHTVQQQSSQLHGQQTSLQNSQPHMLRHVCLRRSGGAAERLKWEQSRKWKRVDIMDPLWQMIIQQSVLFLGVEQPQNEYRTSKESRVM